MAQCEVCGNEYDKTMQITLEGRSHVFDSFECAMHALAPRCGHCGVQIVGHGVESGDQFFCCANCATVSGVRGMHDRD